LFQLPWKSFSWWPSQAVWSKCFVRFVKLIYLQLGGLQLVFIPLPVHYDQSELLIAFM
jgi:hypothetical protein